MKRASLFPLLGLAWILARPALAEEPCLLYKGRFGLDFLAKIEDGLIYRDRYWGEAVARIDGDKVYRGRYGYDAILHMDGDVFYKGAYGYEALAHYQDGVLYRGRWGYDAMAHYADGVVYKDHFGYEALAHGESCGERQLSILTLVLGLAPAEEILRESAAGLSVLKGMVGTRYLELEINRGAAKPYIRELSDRAWRGVELSLSQAGVEGTVGESRTSLERTALPDGALRLEGETQGLRYAAQIKPAGAESGRAWVKALREGRAPFQMNLEYDSREIRSRDGSSAEVLLRYERNHTSLPGYSFLSGHIGRERVDLLLYGASIPEVLEHLYLLLDLETPVEFRSIIRTPL